MSDKHTGGFDAIFQTSKGGEVPPGVHTVSIENPLTVIQKAHAVSDRVQQTAYQGAFDAINTFVETVKDRELVIDSLREENADLKDAIGSWADGARQHNEENDELRTTLRQKEKKADDADDTARTYERRALSAEAKVSAFTALQSNLLQTFEEYGHSKKLVKDGKKALSAIEVELSEVTYILGEM